jgi:hypothetical protein
MRKLQVTVMQTLSDLETLTFGGDTERMPHVPEHLLGSDVVGHFTYLPGKGKTVFWIDEGMYKDWFFNSRFAFNITVLE